MKRWYIFENHPDLRKLLLDYGAIGNPLLKHFALPGYSQIAYTVRKGLIFNTISLSQTLRNFTYQQPWLYTIFIINLIALALGNTASIGLHRNISRRSHSIRIFILILYILLFNFINFSGAEQEKIDKIIIKKYLSLIKKEIDLPMIKKPRNIAGIIDSWEHLCDICYYHKDKERNAKILSRKHFYNIIWLCDRMFRKNQFALINAIKETDFLLLVDNIVFFVVTHSYNSEKNQYTISISGLTIEFTEEIFVSVIVEAEAYYDMLAYFYMVLVYLQDLQYTNGEKTPE